ncbi:MAG: hypothetical protein ACI8RD_000804, partial [Bacillariaceae sp.]
EHLIITIVPITKLVRKRENNHMTSSEFTVRMKAS